jgi:K+-transporting ATPase ATPase C chain
MRSELLASLRPALVLLILFSLLLGLAYPALITGVAQVAMPAQANGSLVREGDRVVGSELIAQGFAGPGYFHPRASAAGKGYDAAATAATNLAPGSQDLRDAVATRVAQARAEGLKTGGIPADLVTTSASGLDPDLSPEAALAQSSRIAATRNLPERQVRELVERNVAGPLLGLIGERRVNVLALNRQLDRIAPNAVR